jgi:hypothetical protein
MPSSHDRNFHDPCRAISCLSNRILIRHPQGYTIVLLATSASDSCPRPLPGREWPSDVLALQATKPMADWPPPSEQINSAAAAHRGQYRCLDTKNLRLAEVVTARWGDGSARHRSQAQDPIASSERACGLVVASDLGPSEPVSESELMLVLSFLNDSIGQLLNPTSPPCPAPAKTRDE